MTNKLQIRNSKSSKPLLYGFEDWFLSFGVYWLFGNWFFGILKL